LPARPCRNRKCQHRKFPAPPQPDKNPDYGGPVPVAPDHPAKPNPPPDSSAEESTCGAFRLGRVLVKGAWTYRYPARVSEILRGRMQGLPKTVRDIAWKGQVRLCARYRRLVAAGKKTPVVVAAIAREMAAFARAVFEANVGRASVKTA
jgi:hypothetical protein